jgi:hypothetical protein
MHSGGQQIKIMNLNNPDSQVQKWLNQLSTDKKKVIDILRSQIASAMPNTREFIYHDSLGYSPVEHGSPRTVYIAVFESHINLGFFYGAFLEDTQDLLIGNGKRMRHIKIVGEKGAKNPAIKKLLEQAEADYSKYFPSIMSD